MNSSKIPRIVTPLAIATAIVVSFRAGPSSRPVELSPGEPPAPSASETRSALALGLAPDGPGHDRGATRAPVTVVEFADFGCRYCARFAAESWPYLEREFVATGRVRWRYVPFALGMFRNGDEAARAAECAADQGAAAFGRMHDALYLLQEEWKGAGDATVAFRSIAAMARLDLGRFASCYAGPVPGRRLNASNLLADQLGVRATPTFFIDGQRVEGALPVQEFRYLLLEALRKSREDSTR
jgi:protein-disulfide isomerase